MTKIIIDVWENSIGRNDEIQEHLLKLAEEGKLLITINGIDHKPIQRAHGWEMVKRYPKSQG